MRRFTVVLGFFMGASSRPSLWQQPFAPNSIWNLPIGSDAKYVPATLSRATGQHGIFADADIIVFTPTERNVDFLMCTDDWQPNKTRCTPTDPSKVVVSGPIPADFIIPGDHGSLGGTPNAGLSMLLSDNRTIVQAQPAARCSAQHPGTNHYRFPDVDIHGPGITGAHGGSGLSAIGGTIRLGELLPNAPPIRHALKLEFFAKQDYWSQSPWYRWPAVHADGYAKDTYGGTNPSVRPGSLLALAQGIDINKLGLETAPARSLAWTLQNYGGYIVDDAAWSVYQVCFEYGPSGWVADEFEKAYGFTLQQPHTTNNSWTRDMDRIFLSLSVVDNWDETTYNRVAASNGGEGAGGGSPLQSWIAPAE
eukprot:TRINITY_DN16994_c0_g1_i1.p1 TRINITY_DN16994_c0_g1~~TRINITY_DN16994_c0_g1_i1.p1  ORF type:complete len:371 (+),score=28.66 TRINITY_DN16994_c0_g1_i1:24-1115(+)